MADDQQRGVLVSLEWRSQSERRLLGHRAALGTSSS